MSIAANATRPQGRVLVVEDDRIACKYAVRLLSQSGYEVTVAHSGEEAIRILTDPNLQPFDCIATDYQMPGISGLDLLQWINARRDRPAVVLMTGEGERDTLGSFLREGVCDYLDKPINYLRLMSAVGKATQATARTRIVATLTSAVQTMAGRQQMLLEKSHCDRLQVFHHACHHAGGDFAAVHQTRRGTTLILLSDVSGHDLEAAYASAYFQGYVRAMAAAPASTQKLLESFNTILFEEWSGRGSDPMNCAPISMDLCAIEVDCAARRLVVWRCGSPLPVFCDGTWSAATLAYGGSNPLGWFEDMGAACTSQEFEPGASITLWTDGVETLAEALTISPPSLAYRLLSGTGEGDLGWIGTASDDVLVARYHLSKTSDAANDRHALLVHSYRRADEPRIDEIQDYWERSLRFALPPVDEVVLCDVLLCLREALLNAMLHGCDADDYATMSVTFSPSSASLRCEIRDPGDGFDTSRFDNRNPTDEEHRGVLLIRRLPYSSCYDDNGATLRMEWDLSYSQGETE